MTDWSVDQNSVFRRIFAMSYRFLILLGIELDISAIKSPLLKAYAILAKLVVISMVFYSSVIVLKYANSSNMKVAKITYVAGICFNFTKTMMVYLGFIIRKRKLDTLLSDTCNVFTDLFKGESLHYMRLRIISFLTFVVFFLLSFSIGLPVILEVVLFSRWPKLFETPFEDCFVSLTLMLTTYIYLFGVYFYLLINIIITQMLKRFKDSKDHKYQKRNLAVIMVSSSSNFNHFWDIKTGVFSDWKVVRLKQHRDICHLIESIEDIFKEVIMISSLIELIHIIFLIRSIDFTQQYSGAKNPLAIVLSSVLVSFFGKILSGAIINQKVSEHGQDAILSLTC